MEAIALDVHAHIVPVLPARLGALPGIAWNGEALAVDGAPIGLEPASRPEALIAWMDANRVERAWISIPPTLYRLALGPAAARHWAAYVNDGLAEATARFPTRLAPLFHLPLQAPEIAIEIVAEAAASGRARFAMPAGAAEREITLSDPAYDPLWPALDAARAFLFLHPCKGCDPRLDRFYLHNLLGGPGETALAAAHLAMSGILERNPGITICLAHAGGTAAAVAGRLERGQLTGRPGADTGAERARHAFRRFCADCIAHNSAALTLAAERFGADHILFGSDWPYGMGLPEPHRQLADLDPAFRRRILWDNGARLRASAEAG